MLCQYKNDDGWKVKVAGKLCAELPLHLLSRGHISTFSLISSALTGPQWKPLKSILDLSNDWVGKGLTQHTHFTEVKTEMRK
jgi:hypothetical protein